MFTYGIVCFLLLKSTVRSLKIRTQETFFTSTDWCEFQESTTSSLILQHPWSLSCICIFWKSPILVSFTEVHVSYSLSWSFPEPLPGPDPLRTSCEVLSARSAHGCPRATAERCWVPATPSKVNGNSRCLAFLQRVSERDGEYPDTGKKLQAEGGPEGKKICWGPLTSHFFTSPPAVKATGSLCALGGCTPEKPPVLLKTRLPSGLAFKEREIKKAERCLPWATSAGRRIACTATLHSVHLQLSWGFPMNSFLWNIWGGVEDISS